MAYIVLLLTSLLIFFAQVPDASQNRIDLQLKTEIME